MARALEPVANEPLPERFPLPTPPEIRGRLEL